MRKCLAELIGTVVLVLIGCSRAITAADNQSPTTIRQDLRDSVSGGIWVNMPGGSSRTLYRKYSRVLTRTLEPQAIAHVTTFGGVPLTTALRDMYNLDSIRARVHLYEAVNGTCLSLIGGREDNVRGLGSTSPTAWQQIHPLTSEAAGILLGDPGLGGTVDSRYTQDHNLIEIGQRFYFLEIEGAHWVLPGDTVKTRVQGSNSAK